MGFSIRDKDESVRFVFKSRIFNQITYCGIKVEQNLSKDKK